VTTITTIQMYEIISEKLGKEAAESLTSFLEQKVDEKLQQKITVLATKVDLAEVKVDLIKWTVAMWVTTILLIIGLYIKK